MKVKGKRVVITGAASGIGQSLAIAFLPPVLQRSLYQTLMKRVSRLLLLK
ncbi:MAG: hypothetical protein CM1200mP10_08760 [Candidatus Neomarinimicrobiota bacterium]|nr:MAG: hypothetical protein CM1200mP10_08760 [Candidatus Neomarinimicrobiota bacterium]